VDIKVEPRVPQARCYKCGSAKVSALCHHCWRPGCAEHVLPSQRWAELILGREGSGPGLQRKGAYHCESCAHRRAGLAGPMSRRLAMGLAAAGLAAAGLILVWLTPAVGLVLLLAGGAGAVWAYVRIRRGTAEARASMPVALHPKVSDVRMTETVRGEIWLGAHDEDYRTDLKGVEGKVSMTVSFGQPDRERVRRRRRSSAREGRQGQVPFCAGGLLLQGQLGIKAGPHIDGPVVILNGDARQYPVFRETDPPSSSQWPVTLEYLLAEKPRIPSGPVWITPSIVPESARRALELDIQWVEFGPDEDRPLDLEMIEMLRLEFPVAWGTIQSWEVYGDVDVQPRAVTGLTGTGYRSFELTRLRPPRQETGKRKFRAPRQTVSVRFSGRIDAGHEISGHLSATLRGTLSGVTRIRMFSALGAPRSYGTPAIRTRVEMAFRLSLANIRYQEIRVVSGHVAEETDRARPAELKVIPGDETVIALTNALSEEGYYVKHVIENPPQIGRQARRVQRYWNIAGRRYEGVYPVDFFVMLTGEERYGGGIRPVGGTTKVEIVVKGAFTDDEMDTRVVDEWRRLRELTRETMKRLDSTGGFTGERG